MTPSFIPLHNHSVYSLMDGMMWPSDIAKRCVELGYDAISITDHHTMAGVIDFYKACKKAGIKPIIGMEAEICKRSMDDKDPDIDRETSHLVLLAENNEGYANLLALASEASTRGFYYRPRLDRETLAKHASGVIALSSCLKGEIPKALLADNMQMACGIISEYKRIFGADNFFLEVQPHDTEEQRKVNNILFYLQSSMGARVVGTFDSHYAKKEDSAAQRVLIAANFHLTLAEMKDDKYAGLDLSYRGPEVALIAFGAKACAMTREIADRCNVTLELDKPKLPTAAIPDAFPSADAYLRHLVYNGAKKRYQDTDDAVRNRIDYELSVIGRMGYAGYFLIVHEYVSWAKANGILVGPGRGSAAGSIVSYCLGITGVDPIRHGLLFERFLNPDRISLPDIDVDFADVDRERVVKHIIETYGNDRVAGIANISTLGAKAAIRDVGRVFGMPYMQVDAVAKAALDPVQGVQVPIRKSRETVPELMEMEKDPEVKRLLDMAERIEGSARHSGQHACGIVISDRPLIEIAPLQRSEKGGVTHITQFDSVACESAGLVKVDILGLSNLSTISHALELIKKVHNTHFSVEDIPLDDEETYEMLSAGKSQGVFQLESEGMRDLLRRVKPAAIEDVSTVIALYRPGPMQFIDSYVARRSGTEKIAYRHPLMEPSLKGTYGIPIFQESVMQLAKDIAGFGAGQADTLRKAIGKKDHALMSKLRISFVDGCVGNGVPRPDAEAIFDEIEEFGSYSFNLSHSMSYAYIAYWTAYLKCHFPECYMAALMGTDSEDLDRISLDIAECRRMGISVLPPDVRESSVFFAPTSGRRIRFGLSAIKGVSFEAALAITLSSVSSSTDLADFLKRLPVEVANKRVLDALAKSGALDAFGSRGDLCASTQALAKWAREKKDKPLPLVAGEMSSIDMLRMEKESIGIYVSGHPAGLGGLAEAISGDAGKKVSCRVLIEKVKRIITKTSGEEMAFVTAEDASASVEIVVFPRTYGEYGKLLKEGVVVHVSGRTERRDGKTKVLADEIKNSP